MDGKMNSLSKRFTKKLMIRHKMMLAIYMVLVPVVIAGAIFLYGRTYRTTMEENISLYQRFTQTICDDIVYLQQDVQDVATYFAVNTDIHKVLTTPAIELKRDPLFWSKQTPVTFLQDMLAIKSQIKTVILYPESGAQPFYISRDASVHNKNLKEIRNLPVYQAAHDAKGDVVWLREPAGTGGLYLNNKSDKVVACRALYDLSKRRRLGFLAVGMEASRYTDICESMLSVPNEGIVVLDSKGAEISRTGRIDEEVLEFVRKGDFLKVDHWNGYYIFNSRSEETGIQVCYMSPEKNWKERVRQTLAMPVLLGISLLVLTGPLSIMVSGGLTKPIAALCKSMEKFKEGDFNQAIEAETEDEIGILSRTFNQMVNDLRDLIEKNYVMALREKESELNALQAQINPHFLYNVLDSLYWQAVGSGNEELGEDVLALSKLFRLLLSHGQSEVNVATELELITSYLQIQKMRFSKRLDYEIDVEEDLLKCRIGKLTLQPFVENAIVHGLEIRGEGGLVKVTGRKKGNTLVFEILDNGVGMEQEEADRILLAEEGIRYSNARIGHYAIRNIKERLYLKYGDSYSLNIYSRPHEGTRVRLEIPEEL
ncbi:MAG: sensor histidine kinase [Lacrimispora sphenoides]